VIRTLFIFALALLPEGLFSQSAATATPPPQSITKVIRVHYGAPHIISNILRTGAPHNIDWDGSLKAVILHGKPSDVASGEQTIKELDVPPAVSTSGDIELIVRVVGGSNEAMATSTNLSTIEPVVKQLRAIFPFKNYELLSTVLMRSQQGKSAGSSGLIKYPFGDKGSPYPDHYGISYETASVSAVNAKTTIHLEKFQFQGKISLVASTDTNNSQYHTSQYQTFDVGIKSDVDLRAGQQVVVGNTHVASGNSALFIVLTAKLVD